MSTNPSPRTRKAILADMHDIPVIIEGTLGERRGAHGQVTGHRLQRWKDGKNHTLYIPEERVEPVRQGTAGFQRFTALSREYVDCCELEALHPADTSKKKRTRR